MARLPRRYNSQQFIVHERVFFVRDFDLRSQNGGITLVMAEGCAGRVDAATGRGVVRSDFPVDCVGGVQTRRRLQGTIGSGPTELKMITLNGNLWIARSRT